MNSKSEIFSQWPIFRYNMVIFYFKKITRKFYSCFKLGKDGKKTHTFSLFFAKFSMREKDTTQNWNDEKKWVRELKETSHNLGLKTFPYLILIQVHVNSKKSIRFQLWSKVKDISVFDIYTSK